MSKHVWSKLTWLILGILPLLLIACSGGAADPIVTVPPPATDEPVPSTTEPIVEEPAAESVDMVEEVEAEMADGIVPVAGKPQLIEFYADW